LTQSGIVKVSALVRPSVVRVEKRDSKTKCLKTGEVGTGALSHNK